MGLLLTGGVFFSPYPPEAPPGGQNPGPLLCITSVYAILGAILPECIGVVQLFLQSHIVKNQLFT